MAAAGPTPGSSDVDQPTGADAGLGYVLAYAPNHNHFMREKRKLISKKSAHHPEVLCPVIGDVSHDEYNELD